VTPRPHRCSRETLFIPQVEIRLLAIGTLIVPKRREIDHRLGLIRERAEDLVLQVSDLAPHGDMPKPVFDSNVDRVLLRSAQIELSIGIPGWFSIVPPTGGSLPWPLVSLSLEGLPRGPAVCAARAPLLSN
jgi:hypothetical protein